MQSKDFIETEFRANHKNVYQLFEVKIKLSRTKKGGILDGAQ